MSKLIKITENEEGKRLVSARELYLGLGLNKTAWSRWYRSNIEENTFFEKGIDFIGVRHNVEGNEVQDFAISLDFAKNMALEGCSKSKINKVNYLDVIEGDKKLLNGYLSIISKLAIKHGVGGNAN